MNNNEDDNFIFKTFNAAASITAWQAGKIVACHLATLGLLNHTLIQTGAVSSPSTLTAVQISVAVLGGLEFAGLGFMADCIWQEARLADLLSLSKCKDYMDKPNRARLYGCVGYACYSIFGATATINNISP